MKIATNIVILTVILVSSSLHSCVGSKLNALHLRLVLGVGVGLCHNGSHLLPQLNRLPFLLLLCSNSDWIIPIPITVPRNFNISISPILRSRASRSPNPPAPVRDPSR